MRLSLFHDPCQSRSEAHYQRFLTENVLSRLRALDARAAAGGLTALDPADPLVAIGTEISDGRVSKNSYGVLNLAWQAQCHREWPAEVVAEVKELKRRIRDTHSTPLRFLIWAGMGGSIEDKSMYQACGLLKRGPRFYALDSTDPAKLKYILDDMTRRSGLSLGDALKATLVVGMAMGMTSYEPVVNLEKIAALYDRFGIDSRPNFIFMTLPGSLLDRFAGPRGYRQVPLQLDGANSTAGRHSGPLTRGSLYPLALCDVDLEAWMAGAFLDDDEISTAWRLAAFLHAQGECGRDKITLLLPKPWSGAGIWTKQNFEESLGKSEACGIKIIIGERPRMANYRPPKDPGQDRAFLAVTAKGMPEPDTGKTALLRRSGYPMAALALPAGTPLSRYMQFVHYTVLGLGYLREMNFVTQPGVELYKSITNRLYEEARKSGGIQVTPAWRELTTGPRQSRWRGVLSLSSQLLEPDGDAPEQYAAIIKRLRASQCMEYGELTFFGDIRYNPAGKRMRKRLERAAEGLYRRRLNMPADVYEGPPMNHSYHEMIIGHGKCFSTILLSEKQEELPAAGYQPDYHLAQFLATRQALEQRGRPVATVTLRDLGERSLAVLDEFFKRAAAALK